MKTFEILDIPIRAVRFIAAQNWFVCGSDDGCCRVYNYYTMERIAQFDAHQDYIRSIAVHATLPLVLTASDDHTVKLWDFSQGWAHVRTYEGHSHYVMAVVWNPREGPNFATASLDNKVKLWNTTTSRANFSLEHDKGVNCVAFYPGSDKPYLVSGTDDGTVFLWDFPTRSKIHVLKGHTNNVSCVGFHADLPIVVSGSEDESVRLTSLANYRLQNTLQLRMGRVWAVEMHAKTGLLCVGMDRGMVALAPVTQNQKPLAMDANGKVLYAEKESIYRIDLKATNCQGQDGTPVPVTAKELSTIENTPLLITYNSNNQFACVQSEKAYAIYTTLTWRPKTFGAGISFAWGPEPGTFIVLETSSHLKFFRSFAESDLLRFSSSVKAVHGGNSSVFSVSAVDIMTFYSWESLQPVGSIAVAEEVQNVEWNTTGSMVALATKKSIYIMSYESSAHTDSDKASKDKIVFVLQDEILKYALSVRWVRNVLLILSSDGILYYRVGGFTGEIAHVAQFAGLIGYITREERIYVLNPEGSVSSFQFSDAVALFMSLIAAKQIDSARNLINKIPKTWRIPVAKFLESRDERNLALALADESTLKFRLAISQLDLTLAFKAASETNNISDWKKLADLAMTLGNFELSESALLQAKDYAGLLLLYHSTGNWNGIRDLLEATKANRQFNVAFMCAFTLSDVASCIDILLLDSMFPQAAIFARRCRLDPEMLSKIVQKWKAGLLTTNPSLAERIADPVENPGDFSDVAPLAPYTAELIRQNLSEEVISTDTVNRDSCSPEPSNDEAIYSENGEINGMKSDASKSGLSGEDNFEFEHTPTRKNGVEDIVLLTPNQYVDSPVYPSAPAPTPASPPSVASEQGLEEKTEVRVDDCIPSFTAELDELKLRSFKETLNGEDCILTPKSSAKNLSFGELDVYPSATAHTSENSALDSPAAQDDIVMEAEKQTKTSDVLDEWFADESNFQPTR